MQILGLAAVLFGVVIGLSDPLGDEAFKAEFRYALAGVALFGGGWLTERLISE